MSLVRAQVRDQRLKLDSFVTCFDSRSVRKLCVERGDGSRQRIVVPLGPGDTMKSCSYNSDELAYLHNLLETLISEAKQMSLELSAEDIIERLYDLADEGERDLNRFRAAILKSAASTSARRAA